jgi:hypothetical protein
MNVTACSRMVRRSNFSRGEMVVLDFRFRILSSGKDVSDTRGRYSVDSLPICEYGWRKGDVVSLGYMHKS